MSKILVVDDDAMNLRMAEVFLKKAGHEISKASSGMEGISILKADTYDLVLLDIEMPELNGFKTLEMIREDASTANTRVVFLSADITDEAREKAKSLGALDFISKPFVPGELLKRVEDALS